MERHLQDIEEIKSKLSVLESEWKDEFAEKVLQQLGWLRDASKVDNELLIRLLQDDYQVALTVFRLFLEKSKDEFNTILRQHIFDDQERIGKNLFIRDPRFFVNRLSRARILEIIRETISRPVTWKDVITERLKSGRGSAIKGQVRGRLLEDFTEDIVQSNFGDQYDARCNFTGKEDRAPAKADFAIPNKDNPTVVIEVKAYGATGSKQTDSIGDVNKIIQSKRHDTYFLFVTDGITWLDRISDLRKIVRAQNEGYIYRIYTKDMVEELSSDLQQIKQEVGL
ncbi:type II restriction endonuclease [Membranihabitans maritimus]|uniref:type II restriction endonuclease n=1 Tax=Membranihabitans maritimus TaxID=2904244 RepID=UPI001F1D7909|nr:type II restriction endonuclease [Membranihabitans maritimus]